MRGSLEIEAQVRSLVAAARGPTFNVEGHAKLVARRYGNHPIDLIRKLILQELRTRRDLEPT